jgi:hypothetical protein
MLLLWVLIAVARAATPPLVAVDIGHAVVPAFHGVAKTPADAAAAMHGQWIAEYGGDHLLVMWSVIDALPGDLDDYVRGILGGVDLPVQMDLASLRHLRVAGHDAVRLAFTTRTGEAGTLVLWICEDTHRLFQLFVMGQDVAPLARGARKLLECHGHGGAIPTPTFHLANQPPGWVSDPSSDVVNLHRPDRRQIVSVATSTGAGTIGQKWVDATGHGFAYGVRQAGTMDVTGFVMEDPPARGARVSAVAEMMTEDGALRAHVRIAAEPCPGDPTFEILLVDIWTDDLPPEEHVDPRTLVECAPAP